jgi:hypothetical protein
MLVDYRSQFEANSKVAPLVLGDVVLVPGHNDVNPTHWKSAMGNIYLQKKIQEKMDAQIIVVRNEADVTNNLRDFTVTESSKIIGETFDIPLLEQWLDHDTRKGVRKDIEEQIAKIKEAGAGTKEANAK